MSPFPHRPTLADVAEAAGVSPVTVSRVVEGSPKVAEATKSKVQAAMDRIGYFGNAAASHLVSGRARTVGVVTADLADYGYASAIRGIEQRARAADMAVLIAVIEGEDPESIRKTVATVASNALAGVIAMDWDPTAHAVVPSLPAYLPVVTTKAPAPGSGPWRPYISYDERAGARLAAEHLIELGHRSVFVLGPPHDDPQEGRPLGVLDALTAARLPHYPVVRCGDWTPRSGHEGTCRLLDDYGEQVTAIACGNDEIAVGAIRAVYDRGLRVPEDVSVIGFDNDPVAAYVRPALTTMDQDFDALGGRAFDLLREVIAGAEPAPETMTPTLVVRESTAPPNHDRGPGYH